MLILCNRLLILMAVFVGSSFLLANDRPNILFFLCDDLGYGDVGVFYQNSRGAGQPSFKTPYIDQLARDGMQLRAHYVAAPVCAPSRASFFLGQSQGNCPVRNNQFDKALPDQPTLASVLREAGYRTGLVGKWGLQGEKDVTLGGVDAWSSYPTKRGFDYFLGYVRHVDGHEHYPYENIYLKNRKMKAKLWEQGREISSDLKGCYTTDLFTAAAKRFIVSHHNGGSKKPFFLTLSYDTPHAATQVATMAYPRGFGVDGGVQWLGRSGEMINTAGGEVDSYIHPDYASKEWKDVSKRYASSIRRIDHSVADILGTLKDLGLDRNTLIVFTSDHGASRESYIREKLDPSFFQSFGPFTGIKRDCWEGGIRPGAIVRWDGKVKSGSVSEEPSQMQDWMPTFCDVAKTSTPAIADGVSLLPMLMGKEGEGSEIYVEYKVGGRTAKYDVFPDARSGQRRGEMQVIRQGRYKAIRCDIKQWDDDFMVFDVVSDPAESLDIAGHKGVPGNAHWLAAVSRCHHTNDSARRPYDGMKIQPIEVKGVKTGVNVGKGEDVRETSYVSRDSFQLSGFIDVKVSGAYTFALKEGVRGILRVHKIHLVDTDSEDAYSNDRTLNLSEGKHPFTLYLRKKPVGKEMILWKLLGDKGFEFIPATSYFH